MRWGLALLVAVFVRHDTSYLASHLTPLTPGAWFTTMGGLWEVILCFIVQLYVRSHFAVAACWIGIIEGAQIAVCRPFIADISQVPQDLTLCDFVTGWRIGIPILVLELLIVCWAIGKNWRSASRSSSS
jgi:dipeptide/tripeptide permease